MFQTLKPKTDPLSQSVKAKNDPLSSNQNPQKITTTKMFGNLQPSKSQTTSNNNNTNNNNTNNNNILPQQKKQSGMLDFFKKAEKISEPELILIMGDVHIPNRIDHIPIEIKNILEKNKSKFSRILCTGNFGNIETYDWFKSLLSPGHEFNCVKNDFQETNLSFPEKLMIKSNKFKIGIINGYQIVPWGDLTSLSAISKQLECDVLISGFTHINGVYNFEGKWFINPGTLTGAFSSLSNNPSPSFMLLLTVEDSATLYLYELDVNTKNFDVKKIELTKS
jgi:vacuolar protein sorting-associated protein 29